MKGLILLGAENINQNAWGAINGCEAASLLEGLHFQKRAEMINYGQFLLDMPISADGNPYRGFGGSPFKNQIGKFEAIFVTPLMQWGSRYGSLINLSGAAPWWLYQSLKEGSPVLVYVTVHFEDPKWEQYPFGKVPTNNHAVLLDGIDSDRVHVSDPIDGKYWLDRNKFETIYNSRRMAVTIQK